jgi:hypothetical protein
MRRRQPGNSGKPFTSACPFAGHDERDCQQCAKRDPHTGAEQPLLDRVAHEKDAAEYYSKATDPDRPLRSEALFEAHPWRDGRGLWGRRDGHGDGRLTLGQRRGFLRRCLRLGHRGRGLGCGRNRFMRRRRGRGRRGRRYAALERGEPRFDATQVLAEPDRLHQGGDGDDREREQQQREQDEE